MRRGLRIAIGTLIGIVVLTIATGLER